MMLPYAQRLLFALLHLPQYLQRGLVRFYWLLVRITLALLAMAQTTMMVFLGTRFNRVKVYHNFHSIFPFKRRISTEKCHSLPTWSRLAWDLHAWAGNLVSHPWCRPRIFVCLKSHQVDSSSDSKSSFHPRLSHGISWYLICIFRGNPPHTHNFTLCCLSLIYKSSQIEF